MSKETTRVYLSVDLDHCYSDDRKLEYQIEMLKAFFLMHYSSRVDDVEFVHNYVPGRDFWCDGDRKRQKEELMKALGEGIKLLATCDMAVFGPCWSVGYTCKIEHEACKMYDKIRTIEVAND